MGDAHIRQFVQIRITDGHAGCPIISSHSLEDFFQRNLQIAFHFWQFVHYKLVQKSKQYHFSSRQLNRLINKAQLYILSLSTQIKNMSNVMEILSKSKMFSFNFKDKLFEYKIKLSLTSEVKLGLVKFQLLLFFVEFFFQELVLQLWY